MPKSSLGEGSEEITLFINCRNGGYKPLPKKQKDFSRVVYDRVRKRKNYFEIPAFLQIERGKSRAGKFKTLNENKNKNGFVFVFVFI